MKKESKEILNPERVFLLSPVFQPKWYEGVIDESRGDSISDKIRGDFIIENLRKANELGYSVVLVYDKKDNPQFIKALKAVESSGRNKIFVQEQDENGYSQARREAVRKAQEENSGCEVMVMLELEKPMIEHIPDMVKPILEGRADVTITDRGIKTDGVLSNDPEKPNEDLRDLPWYQARSEKKFCNWANKKLKELGWMLKDDPDLDLMGNRAWRNLPVFNSLFLARFKAESDNSNLKPDHLSASLFYPLVTLLWENKIRERVSTYKIRLVSVPIDYHHPKIQSELENKDISFIKKRDNQREMLTAEMEEFIKLLQGQESLVSLK